MFNWLLLLIAYLPFQIALNPGVLLEELFGVSLGLGIDLASIRVFIVLLFIVWLLAKNVIGQISVYRSRFKNLQSISLFIFLILAGFSLFGAENVFWGIRKIIFLISIFPLYFLVVALTNNWLKVKKIILILIKGSGLIALVGFFQFFAPFVFSLGGVYRFWAIHIVPVFAGFNFGAMILAYPSWLVNVSGQVILRAFSLFSDPHMFSFYLGLILPLVVVWLGILEAGKDRQCVFWNNLERAGMVPSEARRASGSLSKKFSLGTFCVSRRYLPILYILLFVALLLSFTRGAYAAIIVTFLVLAGLLWKYLEAKKITGLLCLSLLIFIIPGTPISDRFYSSFDITEGSNVGRLEMWQQAGQTGLEHFWQGVGLGNYSLMVDATSGYRNPITAHNLYLDFFSEGGFFVLLAWLILILGTIGQLFWRLNKERELGQEQKYLFIGLIGSLVYFFTHSFFETAIYNPVVLAVLMVILGMATTIQNHES